MTRGILTALFLVSCGADEKEETVEYEGDDAGECSDGADNDLDGYFDCQDNGCWGSPDCAGTGTAGGTGGSGDGGSGDGGSGDGGSGDGGSGDGGSGDGGSGDGGSGDGGSGDGGAAGIAAHLTAFDLSYTLTLDFDTFGETYFTDCENTYSASGDQVGSVGEQVTFEGPWVLSGTTCTDNAVDLAESIAWLPDSGRSYATFHFDGSVDTLDAWIQHRDLDDTEPLSSPSSEGQWYITAMATPVVGGLASYNEQEEAPLEGGLITIFIDHAVVVQFSED